LKNLIPTLKINGWIL